MSLFIPKIEEYEDRTVRLRDGRVFDRVELLRRADEEYRKTRRTINLLNPRRPVVYQARPRPEIPPQSKYTLEEAEWMIHQKGPAIAARYRCSISKAYNIKHYCRSLYGI